ncbi:hypothetical protein [Noviherbaspirillum sp. UKPF54]|uniref:hypothetical protein n=1 Tax=Noviherbaspirillum sp. UKPF54 TaxID=2601898 RepID=UPI0011B11F52|nr:hypothetical protein [Noviherbaspirillum sp. UKPF54]QDZ29385.1 hypothetical protein FAY22_16325 [Noviherbaspirillum sp. UKPF54]
MDTVFFRRSAAPRAASNRAVRFPIVGKTPFHFEKNLLRVMAAGIAIWNDEAFPIAWQSMALLLLSINFNLPRSRRVSNFSIEEM